MVHVPGFKVKAVDTTGAGDAFMGGLSYGLLQGWDLQKVGIFRECLRRALLHESRRARHVQAQRSGRVHQVEQSGGRACILSSALDSRTSGLSPQHSKEPKCSHRKALALPW